MIELSLNQAFMLYLALCLATMSCLWGYLHLRTLKKEILPPEKRLKKCEFCHYDYLAASSKKISRCPCCQAYNE